MINRMSLRLGSSPAADPLSFEVGPITVIVGPNYSGKSKLIREIQHVAHHGVPASDAVILDDFQYHPFSQEEVEEAIKEVTLKPRPGEVVQPDHIMVGRNNSRHQANLANFRSALQSISSPNMPSHYRSWASQWYFSSKTRLLDGQGRISLTNDQPFGDLLQEPVTTFQHIFRDDVLREKIRAIVFDAFGLYLVVDPTQAGQLRLRLSARAPLDFEEEQSLTQRSANFHGEATLLAHASDGTRAFCGILTEVMSGNPDLLLLDEPEAFLHPGLSYKLGLEMARQVQHSKKNIFVSTHSPNFLMGCVASGVPVNVIRMTYRAGVGTARLLPSEKLSNLMRNPLLRSANVLSALFFDNVVLTEGDTDRAFYQEINNRLLASGEERGIPNALFVNANGKDAIPVMMEPLRDLGVAVAAIYDMDFVKDGGASATRRLRAAKFPEQFITSIGSMRSAVKADLEKQDPDYKKNGGAQVLVGDALRAFETYRKQLGNFGIFLVLVGEVEGWLKSLGINGHAAQWLIPMFERMGEEGQDGYLLPKKGDVWDFLDEVNVWLRDPNRSGMG